MDSETIAKKRNTKILVVLCIIIFLSIIGYSVFTLVNRIGKIPVTVQYAPYVAEVTLDDTKLLKNNAVNYLIPGTYTIKVTYDGFDTLEETVNIDDNTKNIYGMLNSNSPEGEQLAKKYQNDFLDVQSLYGQASIAKGEQQRKEWPVLNSLPQNNILYSLGYILEDDTEPIITIRADTTYLDSAVQELIGLAKSPQTIATYNVKINNFTNELTSFTNNTNSDPVEYLKAGYNNIPSLAVNSGEQNGEYYYTTITTGNEELYTLVTYRVILHQTGNNSWQITSTPYPILTTYNTPDTPIEVLNAANNL